MSGGRQQDSSVKCPVLKGNHKECLLAYDWQLSERDYTTSGFWEHGDSLAQMTVSHFGH